MTQDTRTPIGYIYKIHCTLPEISGVYIGKTTRTIKQRFKQHCGKTGSNSKIGKAIQLYGPQNFVVTELAVAYTQDDLSDWNVTLFESTTVLNTVSMWLKVVKG